MLIVDAYNVLHTTGVLPPELAGPDLGGLADLIEQSRYGGGRVRLICDGVARGDWRGHARIEIRYAGPGREADDLIERMLRSESSPRKLIVVSSDRRLRKAARRARARSLPADVFLRQLTVDATRRQDRPRPAFATDIPLDGPSVAWWMDHFDARDLIERGGRPEPGPRREVPKPAPPPSPKPERILPPGEEVDPLLLDALEEWAGDLRLDDLDMGKWLDDPDNSPS